MSVQKNVEWRKAGESLAETMAAYVLSELGPGISDVAFWRRFDELTKAARPKPAEVKPVVRRPAVTEHVDGDAEELLSEVFDLIEQVQEASLPGAAHEFAQSAGEFAESLDEQFVSRGKLSTKQCAALENIRDGLRRWLKNDD
jgi:hypothetical protein